MVWRTFCGVSAKQGFLRFLARCAAILFCLTALPILPGPFKACLCSLLGLRRRLDLGMHGVLSVRENRTLSYLIGRGPLVRAVHVNKLNTSRTIQIHQQPDRCMSVFMIWWQGWSVVGDKLNLGILSTSFTAGMLVPF